MSRIQQILEKAERDGSVRRLRPEGQGAVQAVLASAAPPGPPSEVVVENLGASAATAVPEVAPIRIATGARLAGRLLAASATDSIAAEQYRTLRTRILHADNGSAVHVILITSPGRADGRTLTAGNLALTMAQDFQRRICLVDADMRHPQLHRLFGVAEGPGLSDVLAGHAALEDALLTIEEQQLTLLPAGHAAAHPAELLGTTVMRRVLETLRSRFDRVVIDAPPVAPLADVGILAPLVDSVVLVVRAGATPKPAIHEAVGAIEPSKLLGVVLNDVA